MRPRAIGNALLYVLIVALLFRSEIAIGLAAGEQTLSGRAMFGRVVRLKHQLFVVIQLQPFEAFENRARRLVRRTLQVGILDAQQEFAAQLARKQPVEQRRARGADVQIAGGRWSEANANSHKHERSDTRCRMSVDKTNASY